MKMSISPGTKIVASVVGVAGTFLIVVLLIALMYYFNQPPPVDQGRVAERAKNLTDLTTQAQEQLNHYGWVDPAKELVRLPIRQAMALTVREWQNPAEARAALLARLEKTLIVPTNAAPEVNPYE